MYVNHTTTNPRKKRFDLSVCMGEYSHHNAEPNLRFAFFCFFHFLTFVIPSQPPPFRGLLVLFGFFFWPLEDDPGKLCIWIRLDWKLD